MKGKCETSLNSAYTLRRILVFGLCHIFSLSYSLRSFTRAKKKCRISSKPELVEGFIKSTFTAMIEGVEKDALNNSLIDKYEWDQGIKDLYRTAEKDGVFCYTFFKGM